MPELKKTPNIKAITIERAECDCEIAAQPATLTPKRNPELIYQRAFIIEGEQLYRHDCPQCKAQWFLKAIYPRNVRSLFMAGNKPEDRAAIRREGKALLFSRKG